MALDKKKLREQWDSLSDEDKAEIRGIIKDDTGDADDDVSSTLKKLGERLAGLEAEAKKGRAKKNGFIATLFGE